MFIYRYDNISVNGDPVYPQQGGWTGGPIELVLMTTECTYKRWPNKEAADAVVALPEHNFREATEDEIETLGDLPLYPRQNTDN